VISPLGVLMFLIAASFTIAVLVAVPASACLWREGSFCERHRSRVRP
jgi:hypothetical protein